MRIHIVYPRWPKLKYQPQFNLPPHGPVCFAASVPPGIDISFCDENVEKIDFNEEADLICISAMLTCQISRAWEIADVYRYEKGKKVVLGGIAAQLHAEESLLHVDSLFLGESEGKFGIVLEDFKKGSLRRVYDYHLDFPDTSIIGTARRDILKRDLYNFRGVQMVDLVHASRGCKFNCFPCCTPFLGGRSFRPRPIDKVVEEFVK